MIKIINILLFDKNDSFTNKLVGLLNKGFNKHKCEITIYAYSDDKKLIKDVKNMEIEPDMAFITLDEPNKGFKIVKEINKINQNFTLIFVANEAKYAVEGYKYGAYRYLLKGNIDEEIEEAIVEYSEKEMPTQNNNEIEFKIKEDSYFDTISINKKDIILLYVDSNKRVILETVKGSYNLLILPLKKYKAKLKDRNFDIIMRAYLINFNHIQNVEEEYFVISNGLKVHLGFSKRARNDAVKKYKQIIIKGKKNNI